MNVATHRTERAGHYANGATWCVHCGVTAGRIARAYADGKPLACVRPATPCGHPLSARAIEMVGGSMRTACWACQVEAI